MKLEKIITLANQTSRLRFLAMERSLRACGCRLPLLVIPYDERKFDLPPGAEWWENAAITEWLSRRATPGHPGRVMLKYQCLLESNYQFVDSDVIFLKDPGEVLEPFSGFITSCGHWHNPAETTTAESAAFLAKRSTVWQSRVFNSGQFACDRALYTEAALLEQAASPEFVATCLGHAFHEQPGLNCLVAATDVPVTNLTLPPVSMESTWAGDYPGDWNPYWTDPAHKPYLIHWAGCRMDIARPIDTLFLNYLSPAERTEWETSLRKTMSESGPQKLIRRVKRSLRAFAEE